METRLFGNASRDEADRPGYYGKTLLRGVANRKNAAPRKQKLNKTNYKSRSKPTHLSPGASLYDISNPLPFGRQLLPKRLAPHQLHGGFSSRHVDLSIVLFDHGQRHGEQVGLDAAFQRKI
ncbi:uncharacterized protein PgNI_00886 [Pyricularia grisea]|uniref:Uncharacterized protein n=1 Tax=Pyricularia grisea TaxID=148305 RepID=A0A6P8BM48_PYRGI|nr:uncharacterized protein PgNI_00886 [Pyricularia grisea]TLD17888.1 hypothetical protein PgNI_00886 [Pyricularia grisea]